MTQIIDRSTSQIEDGNGALSRPATVEIGASRSAQEVQAMVIMAKRFPRDQQAAFARIMQSCKRKSLAELAAYEYPRGGETITGPSIRLAEVMAQAWGNLDFGIIELEQRAGESQVMAFAWDLETNTRQTKIFTVKHERFTRKGRYALEDPRDIYEMAANQGARRLRACILGIIPRDFQEAAIEECDKTMAGQNTEPLADRIRKMIAFAAEQGVTQPMIEAKFGCKADALTERQLSKIRKLFASIRDGMVSVEDAFGLAAPAETGKVENLLNRVKSAKPAPEAVAEAEDEVPLRDIAIRGIEPPTDPVTLPDEKPQQTAPPEQEADAGAEVNAEMVRLHEALDDVDDAKRNLLALARAKNPELRKADFEGSVFKWLQGFGIGDFAKSTFELRVRLLKMIEAREFPLEKNG